ncbi:MULTISPECIES: histidine phosphatase family protein [unclassified Paludibacterium]|uniref:histidine phosphatase family protein n=1 Tax=unclassified Paludibacterium TaxID=2618429 RepID=UPI001C04EA4F|nr:histidine phosphatase family protein [Paludibacterium sp. B53371]BEV70973.1 alpha-ribazole phosphatase [Paludibacterium sp. THUN1379]
MALWLIRHPRPEQADGRCYGRSDLGVSDQALTEAGQALRAALPAGVPLYSSPLQRCARLAEVLAPGQVLYDDRLMEMDFGCWENRLWQDINPAEVDAWTQDLRHYRPGGGESLWQMTGRLQSFCQTLADAGIRDAVLVCHAGVIRLLLALSQGLPPETAAQGMHQIGYGTMLTLSSDWLGREKPCLAP